MELSFIQTNSPKWKYNRGELISSSNYKALMGVWGKQSTNQRQGRTFPDLGCARRFCKLCKIMGYYVAIPFQMIEAPATKMKERAIDSTIYVAKRFAIFLCMNKLHSGERVRLKQDMVDIHLMGQKDTILKNGYYYYYF